MYGIINKAIRDMALKKGGEDVWKEICAKASCLDQDFLLSQSYDDSVTFRLVESASSIFDVPQNDLLRSFGEHWISYTGRQGYDPLMDMFGSDVKEFIGNLNHLHTQVFAALPEARPPHFSVSTDQEESFIVQYRSERTGLAPMVLGLLEGLIARFNENYHVAQKSGRSASQEYDEFIVFRPVGH